MNRPSKDGLGFKIKTISELMSQQMTNRIASLDLTSSQAFVLRYLCCQSAQNRSVSPRDIERHFQLSHPTVSGLLQRLEAKGFILVQPAPDDRRCKQVVPTSRAQQLNEQIRLRIREAEQQLVSGMTPAEVAQLGSFLSRMIQNISPPREGGIHP